MSSKLIKTAAIIALISLFTIALVGCGGSDKSVVDKAKEKGKIVMGTSADFEPFEYIEIDEGKDGEIVGFDVDIAKAIAEKIGVELEIKDMDFGGLISALSSGKLDFVAAGMTADDERRKSVDFSDPYYEAYQVIIKSKGNEEIMSKDDLKDKVIGVQLGTTGDEVASEEEIGAKEVKRFDKATAAILALNNGKIDAVVLDQAVAEANVAQNEDSLELLDEPLSEEVYSLAAPKGDEKLVEIMNQVLNELKESGEYDQLLKKYGLE
ncbi:MAG: basic amino acid ABC transporter substrate-binding protein [Clostridia bacterium]|nr:basic amino acid ABC transporter substrate-binding protein [Clostridia bacterium]